MTRRFAGIIMAGALLAALLPGSAAAVGPLKRPATPLPASVEQLKLAQPVSLQGDAAGAKVDKTLRGASGKQRVIVRLSARPEIEFVDAGPADQQVALKAARAQQAGIISKARRLDGSLKVLGRTGKASNVVMLKIDAKSLATLAKDPTVVAIVPVKDYTLDLSETVPYVGGTTVQKLGYKGQGVDVAILDSGLDYTHAAFGGPGTLDAFKAAYGTSTDDPKNTTLDGLFPTARVKGGYDFVGEAWPDGTGDEAPDPDPIDSPDSGTTLGVDMGTDGGHGTHVADIIGGTNGMAPRANLYSVKVCSSISTACSGVALMEGMDWAMDPNGDGYLTDHVDIVNMSLGSDYGTVYDDDLSLAVERATHYAGILTVASAGNGANKPYIAGTPAAAPSALAVAQTQVPSAKAFPLVISAPAAIAGTYPNTETVEWAPLGTGFSGDVAYVGRGCPADSIDARIAETLPRRPGRQGRPHRSRRLHHQHEGRPRHEGGRHWPSCSASSPPATRSASPTAAATCRWSRPWSSSSRSPAPSRPSWPSRSRSRSASPTRSTVKLVGSLAGTSSRGPVVRQHGQAGDRRPGRVRLRGQRQRRRDPGLRRHVGRRADGHRAPRRSSRAPSRRAARWRSRPCS